ncbi:MAG: hypothetical protein KGO96_09830 [Elusimicrobia bacterium]|nr:hypothetical protein [Elusimicrobiota bacterium]MDE2237482.1 hypothetical protein [Elusimicrobiota bacterium]MDE2426188.1 hypothetical protein [Elusimicrobiota bacterium]
MLCPACGAAKPGSAAFCPSCGRVFTARACAPPAPPPLPSPLIVRSAVYGALALLVGGYGANLYSRYLDAERDRLDSSLLRQVVEHRQLVERTMAQIDAAQPGP